MDVKEKLVEIVKRAAHLCLPSNTKDFHIDMFVTDLIAHGVTVQEWISVKDRLPEDGEILLIYDGDAYQWKPEQSVAKFVKGKSKEQLKAEGYKTICSADEDGNNKKPYKWVSTNSPMSWFGQMVTHWMPLPHPPKGE